MVQLVSVTVPWSLLHAAAAIAKAVNYGDVAADGAVGQAWSCRVVNRPPPLPCGGVAADGAVGQRDRAVMVVQAAAVGIYVEFRCRR